METQFCGISWALNGCVEPDNGIGIGGINEWNEEKVELENYLTELLQSEEVLMIQLDEGNKAYYLNSLDDPTRTQFEVRDELMTVLHLSDEVIKEAIDRFDPLSSNNLKDAILAQAPFSREVLESLRNRIQSISTSSFDMLMTAHELGRTDDNLRTIRSKIAGTKQKLLEGEHKFANELRLGNSEPVYLSFLENSDLVTLKKELIDYRLEQGNTTEALVVLNQIAEEDYLSLTELKVQLKEEDRSIFELSDEEKTVLTNLSNGLPKKGTTIEAQLMLQELGEFEYLSFIDPIGETASKRAYVPDDEVLDMNAIKVSPNPANNFFSVQTNLESRGVLTLYDTNGKVKFSLTIESGQVVSEVEVFDWKEGMYFYQLNITDKILDSGKLSIHH